MVTGYQVQFFKKNFVNIISRGQDGGWGGLGHLVREDEPGARCRTGRGKGEHEQKAMT